MSTLGAAKSFLENFEQQVSREAHVDEVNTHNLVEYVASIKRTMDEAFDKLISEIEGFKADRADGYRKIIGKDELPPVNSSFRVVKSGQ